MKGTKQFIKRFFLTAFVLFSLAQCAEPQLDQSFRNPIIPGYFADPTIKKFGDIYYIYATTDNEMLASGAPTVWYSKDFKHWYNYTMEIPSLASVNLRNFWAPDIIEHTDGKYYLYFGNCQAGCNIYGYVSDTPVGPWTKLNEDDTPVIPHSYPREGFPSLDAQFFTDTDQKVYAYWGTWVHYNGGYAVGELDTQTMKSMKNAQNIPLEQTPNPFEAPYMLKKNDTYLLMYSGGSCHDETYNVRYSYSKSPMGPFTPGANNAILKSTEDHSVHGPGHHSVLEENDDYYIVYHKHDYPMTRGGLSRQICIDKLIFENDSTLKAVVPSKDGIIDFASTKVPKDLALKASITASSAYHLKSLEYDYTYQAYFANDDNNATMWKAASASFPQELKIDLGKIQKVARVFTQFEFASYYYQYKIEYSTDGKHWEIYADQSKNRTAGSPMIDDKAVEARYLRLQILNTEKTGLYAAVWNVAVYGSLFELPLELKNSPSLAGPASPSTKNLLVNLDIKNSSKTNLNSIPNTGSMGGTFTKNNEVGILTNASDGIKAFDFSKGSFSLEQPVPKSLEWNGSYTVATWVKNPEIGKQGECLLSWCDRTEFYLANSYNALFYNSSNYGAAAHLDGHFDMKYNQLPTSNTWHHIVLTFDGVVEKVYVDGVLDNAQNMTLASAIDKAKISIGASDVGEHYSGLMSSMRLYDYALTAEEITALLKETQPKKGN
ncbi:hypothetical protein GCM10011416_00820 [Polaribacter pacificus]|uniref:F5/8 type C domain-containing protein n=1 Tax=Polaribacter pacificus TaxID=1775173 RepID=A0A917HT39_9FLAO|nr:family 43 glycosylhydrolase [Polaribacter pacificus]GGG88402.1 hypothetical protein GCM10011416_00820 [Polaribacter pacificus]